MRVYENQEETLRTGRNSYDMIKWDFFYASYNYCCHYLIVDNQKSERKPTLEPIEYIFGYEQAEDLYKMPIENLMLYVIALICNAGRYNGVYSPYGHWASDHYEDYIREKIAVLLSKNDLKQMLTELPEDERKEFENDLRVLRLEANND